MIPLWSTRLPAGTGATASPAVVSSPAVANGVVYVGSRNGRLWALDARSGANLWDFPAGERVESSPLVRDGVVYCVMYDGRLVALNAADGSLRWSYDTGALQDYSSPNISGDNVVAGGGYPKTNVYAVPIASSNPASAAWSFTTGFNTQTNAYDGSRGQFIYSSPAVDLATGNIFCGSDDGRIYALKPDGTPLWARPFPTVGGIFRASPTVANGKVYLSGGDYDWALHAVDAATGDLVWNAAIRPEPDPDRLSPFVYKGMSVSSPAVDGDFVAIVAGYGNSLGTSRLFALTDNGSAAQQRWAVTLPNVVRENFFSSPALTPTSVLVGVSVGVSNVPSQGRLYDVSRADGTARWYAAGNAIATGGPIVSSPAVADDLVVVGDMSGLVTAYQSILAGDVDGDSRVTALDAVPLMGHAAAGGQAPPSAVYRGDVVPANTVPANGWRSFGSGTITPADADRILQHAVGLAPALP